MNERKKRVLIFSTAYFPFIGGAEIAVNEITDRFPDYDFVMLTAKLRKDLKDSERLQNILVYRVGTGGYLDKLRLVLSGPKKASKLGKFDAVWGIMASYGGCAALRYKKRTNTPFLLTLQEGDSLSYIYSRTWWWWWYFRQIFTQADYIQAISSYLANWAKKMGSLCPLDCVPNGVDTNIFVFTDVGRREIRKEFGIHNGAKVVVTISRLVKKNGISDLIYAMNFLPSNVCLLIIGDGKLRNSYVKLCTKLKLNNRVYFVGEVFHNDLPRYLSGADVFCRPSLSEGQGIAFLEAMAIGIPVVATNVGGISDFLINEQTGLFCRVQDPKDIAEKILCILNNTSLSNHVVENAKQNVEKNYMWNSIALKMREIFENI